VCTLLTEKDGEKGECVWEREMEEFVCVCKRKRDGKREIKKESKKRRMRERDRKVTKRYEIWKKNKRERDEAK
jgi:hypothetical protein